MLVGLITGAGLLVGAAQAIPALDHVRDSARSRAFEFSLVSCWSMPPSKLGELVFPHILGHISIDRIMWYWGGGLYPGMGSPFIFSIYMGLLMIGLCVGGAFARPRGGRFVLLLCTLSGYAVGQADTTLIPSGPWGLLYGLGLGGLLIGIDHVIKGFSRRAFSAATFASVAT